jgi:hypothetical protein
MAKGDDRQMNPEPTGIGAGAIVSILFLGGLFVLMAYFVWKAYQRPRQAPPPFVIKPEGPDEDDEDEEPERPHE